MNFYVTEDEKRLIDERIRLPPTRSIRQIRTDSFPQHRIHASLYIFLQCLLLRISTLCLLTIKVLKNLLHLPTSANFHQDITLHILMVHQLQETSKHNLIRVLNYLQEQDIPFGRVFSELPTLNDVFLEITGKELRD